MIIRSGKPIPYVSQGLEDLFTRLVSQTQTDQDILEKNRRNYEDQVKRLEDLIMAMLKHFGLKTNIHFTTDFSDEAYKADFKFADHSVYLAKAMTSFEVTPGQTGETPAVEMKFAHLNLRYTRKAGEDSIEVENLQCGYDLYGKDKDAATNALHEICMAAVASVINAKAMGWAIVDARDNKDPIMLLALKFACDETGMKYIGPDIKKDMLPANTHFEQKIYDSVEVFTQNVGIDPCYEITLKKKDVPLPQPVPLAA